VFITLALLGQRVWFRLHMQPAPAGAAKVWVVAQQFQWNFHYAGADGKFGKIDPKKISDGSLNYIGLDDADPASADDAVVQTLVLPDDEYNSLIVLPQTQFQSRVTELYKKYPIPTY